MERPVSIDSSETRTASPVWDGGGASTLRSAPERAMSSAALLPGRQGMTREEAYASCPDDSYVELYGHQWLIVPLAPIEQPRFFVCTPGLQRSSL